MSVSDNPGEESPGSTAVRGFADDTEISDRINELSGAVDEAHRSLDEVVARTKELRAGVSAIAGHGEAENGAVKVTVDASGRLVDIEFTPTVFRIASTQRLREAVKDAAADAVDDAADQYRNLAGVQTDGIPDPLGEFLGGMPEITRMMPPELVSRLSGASVVDTEERAGRLADRDLWEGPNPYEP